MNDKTTSNERIPFAFSVVTGSHPEPTISNEELLRSYLHFGAWLRLRAALPHVETLVSDQATQFDRICACVAFFEQMGMLYEDIVGNFIVWATWLRHSQLRLADLLKRVHLSRISNSSRVESNYFEDVLSRLATGDKSVSVNPAFFMEHLFGLSGPDVLRTLGIHWKPVPSVKAVPTGWWSEWKQLPIGTEELVKHIGNKKNELLTAFYNKIKHGPQMVVSNVQDVAIAKRGLPEDARLRLPPGEYVRALMDGSRTQEHIDEIEGRRVAPFLIHDPYFVEKLFYDSMVPNAFYMWKLGTWLGWMLLRISPDTDFDPSLRKIRDTASRRAMVDLK